MNSKSMSKDREQGAGSRGQGAGSRGQGAGGRLEVEGESWSWEEGRRK